MSPRAPLALAAAFVVAGTASAGTETLAPSYPTVAPGGAQLAWAEGFGWHIWEANPDGSSARVVASAPTVEGISDMRWTPAGLIVDSNFTLYLVRPGSKARALQPAGFTFAAGGSRVASGPERGPGRLVVTDVSTGRHWRMGSPRVNNSGGALSPDGSRVAWTAPAGILVAKVGGTGHRLAAKAAGPTWGPDGRYLTFVRSATDELRLISSSGGRSRLLPVKAGACQQPAWSPDGAAIACASSALQVVTIASGAVRKGPAELRSVAATWAPDGSALYVDGRPLKDEQAKSNCLNIWRLDPATLRGTVVVRGCAD